MFLSIPYISGSQSVGYGPSALASLGNMLKMQIFGLTSHHESEALGGRAQQSVLCDSDAALTPVAPPPP